MTSLNESVIERIKQQKNLQKAKHDDELFKSVISHIKELIADKGDYQGTVETFNESMLSDEEVCAVKARFKQVLDRETDPKANVYNHISTWELSIDIGKVIYCVHTEAEGGASSTWYSVTIELNDDTEEE